MEKSYRDQHVNARVDFYEKIQQRHLWGRSTYTSAMYVAKQKKKDENLQRTMESPLSEICYETTWPSLKSSNSAL